MNPRSFPGPVNRRALFQMMNLHLRDIDGPRRQFVHIGQGVMDFKAIIEALKRIGYRGYVSLEQDKHPGDMKETVRRYLSLMREYIGSSVDRPSCRALP